MNEHKIGNIWVGRFEDIQWKYFALNLANKNACVE